MPTPGQPGLDRPLWCLVILATPPAWSILNRCPNSPAFYISVPADRLAKAWTRESARFERDYNDRLLGGMVMLRWGQGAASYSAHEWRLPLLAVWKLPTGTCG